MKFVALSLGQGAAVLGAVVVGIALWAGLLSLFGTVRSWWWRRTYWQRRSR